MFVYFSNTFHILEHVKGLYAFFVYKDKTKYVCFMIYFFTLFIIKAKHV